MKKRTFTLLVLLGSCLILGGCFSLLKKKDQGTPELTQYIDSELEKFFGILDEESNNLITVGAIKSN